MSEPIRVLIVDDSAFKRDAIEAMLADEDGIVIAGKASDGLEAVEMTRNLKPSVITMDLKMPRMDGVQAIKTIMAEMPTPIIVISTSVQNEVKFTFKCLELGALDFVPVLYDLDQMAQMLVDKVRAVAGVKVMRHVAARQSIRQQGIGVAKKRPETKVVAIAVSTGGPQALERMLPRLPAEFPAGIIIVQHIPAGFSREMADWLNTRTTITVKEAETGDRIVPGQALVAPGGRHLTVTDKRLVKLSKEPSGLTHIPSADVMMESVAGAFGSEAVGVIMTGMGWDGARGMESIKQAGGATIAQDQESSMIFGMNRTAIELGCVDIVVHLDRLAGTIVSLL